MATGAAPRGAGRASVARHDVPRRAAPDGDVRRLGQRSDFGDTWTWDGTRWSKVGPDNDPGQRSLFTWTYDPARARSLLYGGIGFDNVLVRELWQRDAAGWRPLPVAGTLPPGRFAAAAAFDVARDALVVFGGHDLTAVRGDTWVYSANAWREVTGPGPGPRQKAAMAYDAAGQRVILFGGAINWSTRLGDTWSFDGTT